MELLRERGDEEMITREKNKQEYNLLISNPVIPDSC